MAPIPTQSNNEDTKKSSPQNESLEDLKRRVAVLEQEKLKEERARNYAQLERDRVLEFWEITKTRLATAQKAIRRLSLELEQHEFQHSVDIKAYRDRIRALVADSTAREAELQAHAASVLQQKITEMERTALENDDKYTEEVSNARSKQNIAENAISECKIECQRQITEQRLAADKEIAAMQLRYDEELQSRMVAAEETCHSSMYQAAQQRDTALANATAAHEDTLREAREENAAIVAAQLDLIAALKNDVLAAKQREAVALEEVRKLQKRLKISSVAAVSPAALPLSRGDSL